MSHKEKKDIKFNQLFLKTSKFFKTTKRRYDGLQNLIF